MHKPAPVFLRAKNLKGDFCIGPRPLHINWAKLWVSALALRPNKPSLHFLFLFNFTFRLFSRMFFKIFSLKKNKDEVRNGPTLEVYYQFRCLQLKQKEVKKMLGKMWVKKKTQTLLAKMWTRKWKGYARRKETESNMIILVYGIWSCIWV